MLNATARTRPHRATTATRPTRAAIRLFVVLALCAPVLFLVSPSPARATSLPRWFTRVMVDYAGAQTVARGQGITIAILDSGVDPHLRAPKGALLPGRDFVHLSRPKPVTGTLLASMLLGDGPIASAPKGLPGLAPAAKVLPVRIAPDKDEPGALHWLGTSDKVGIMQRAIRYAADQGARVILLGDVSACEGYDKNYTNLLQSCLDQLQNAVEYAREKHAVVVVPDAASSGVAALPTLTGVIGVAGLGSDGHRWAKYSGRNSAALVAAPALKQFATGPGKKSYEVWGTAPAAAWVAAAVALVESRFPQLTPTQIIRAISESADHPKGGYDTEVGFGTIDPMGALREAASIQRRPEAAVATRNTIRDAAHLATGSRVEAVRHPAGRLAGFGALMAAGLAALMASGVLLVRGRRVAPARAGAMAGDGPPLPPETTSDARPLETNDSAHDPGNTDAPHPPKTDVAAKAPESSETRSPQDVD